MSSLWYRYLKPVCLIQRVFVKGIENVGDGNIEDGGDQYTSVHMLSDTAHCSQPAPEWNDQPRKVKVHSFGKNWHRKVERMFVTFDKSFRISWWWWMVSLLFLIFKIFVSQLLVVWIYRGPLDWLNWAFQARLLNTLPYISETGATDCRKYIISVVSACLPDHVHRNMMSNIKCY